MKVTLAGGCFWCTEAVYQNIKGIKSVISGYTGGSLANPTYEEVCTGKTGHAECVQIEFDENIISFKEILEVFMKTHNPTTLNRQDGDIGTQYRSAIFYSDEIQRKEALEYILELSNSEYYPDPIVTTLEPLTKFYPAEDYHQEFYKLNGSYPYCKIIIDPKIKKVKEKFAKLLT
jgi:methionine-S-sulfoxide reductase